MRGIAYLLGAVLALTGVVIYMADASGHADEEAAPIFGVKIPPGYCDWKLISVTHEEGDFNQLRAQLGNDVAIKAYREGKLPFPDGTIIVALHWKRVPSEEDNKVFGHVQAFVAGSPVNMQVMVKDAKSTPRRAAGDLGTFGTASRATRRCIKLASPATSLPKLATMSSPITHLDHENC
jgi:Cytochrome P460